MAIYRTIQMSFWTDTKVVDDFTPEDRYFYLYLLTNPHTNLAGCYELSLKQASDETGYNKEVIANLLERFEKVHETIRYSKSTKEVLILNWGKFNWTKSQSFQKPLQAEIEAVKNVGFKRFLRDLIDGVDTVSTPCGDGVGTTVTVTVTDTDAVTDNKKCTEAMFKSEFDELWKMYPRKQGKDKARSSYVKARKDGASFEEVRKGLESYREFVKDTDPKYICMGSTWFNQHRWEDDYDIGRGNKERGGISSAVGRNGGSTKIVGAKLPGLAPEIFGEERREDND